MELDGIGEREIAKVFLVQEPVFDELVCFSDDGRDVRNVEVTAQFLRLKAILVTALAASRMSRRVHSVKFRGSCHG